MYYYPSMILFTYTLLLLHLTSIFSIPLKFVRVNIPSPLLCLDSLRMYLNPYLSYLSSLLRLVSKYELMLIWLSYSSYLIIRSSSKHFFSSSLSHCFICRLRILLYFRDWCSDLSLYPLIPHSSSKVPEPLLNSFLP